MRVAGYSDGMSIQSEHKTTLLDRLLPSREEKLLFLLITAITVAIASVNAVTANVDAERAGVTADTSLPWLYEYSSAVVLLALYPAVLLLVRRMPVLTSNWQTHVPLYLGCSVIFSALHVTGMVMIRKVAFWLFQPGPYIFFGDVMREASYEYRKDIVTFAMFTAVAHLVLARVKPASDDRPKRLQFKTGAQTVYIEAADFLFAKAAGNYVEIHTSAGMHLVRQSLAGFERILTDAGVRSARTHRSYIVATDRIASVTPTSDGDAELTLKSGARLPVSRRFRKALDEVLASA